MRRTIWLALSTAFALTALTACMSDDNEATRGEGRAAALVAIGPQSSAEMQMTIDQVTPPGQAIEVLSYSWGGAGPAGGAPTFGNLNITKTIDDSSPKLFEVLATGQNIRRAELKLYISLGGRPPVNYATYLLEDAGIRSVQNAGAAQGQAVPMEEVSLFYGRIRQTLRTPDASGTQGTPVQFGWDVVAERPW